MSEPAADRDPNVTESHASEPRRVDSVTPAEAEPDGTPPENAPADSAAPTMWDQMGGPMGMVDSGLPVLVFIIVNSLTNLTAAIISALAAGVLIAAFRLARRKPATQAVGGLFAVGVAAFIAYRTGSAKGYFLFGIWTQALYGAVFLISVLARWPLVGAAWEALNGRGTAWRRDRRLVRKYDLATLIWVVVFAARFLVQNGLYGDDEVGWLGVARIVMGYPLFAVAILLTVLIVGSAAGMRLPGWLRRTQSDS